jgi:hypothetical protein
MNFMASEKDITDEKNDENKLRGQGLQAAEDEKWDDDDDDVESGNRRRKSKKDGLDF